MPLFRSSNNSETIVVTFKLCIGGLVNSIYKPSCASFKTTRNHQSKPVSETKEKHDEEVLQRANLTHEEAKRLYHESAALIRAIMDLRECETGRVKLKESSEEIRQKIDDAKRWLGFLKGVGKKFS